MIVQMRLAAVVEVEAVTVHVGEDPQPRRNVVRAVGPGRVGQLGDVTHELTDHIGALV